MSNPTSTEELEDMVDELTGGDQSGDQDEDQNEEEDQGAEDEGQK